MILPNIFALASKLGACAINHFAIYIIQKKPQFFKGYMTLHLN
jgi:hypothetical protein